VIAKHREQQKRRQPAPEKPQRILDHPRVECSSSRVGDPRHGRAALARDFSSGYVQRSLALTPKQGPKAPWRQNQNYFTDLKQMRKAPIEDEALVFTKAGAVAKPTKARAAE
jgi:hypothetical protein